MTYQEKMSLLYNIKCIDLKIGAGDAVYIMNGKETILMNVSNIKDIIIGHKQALIKFSERKRILIHDFKNPKTEISYDGNRRN